MTHEAVRESVIHYWMEKADESLASSRAEQQSQRYHFAVNRAYYACFYAASAILLREGIRFKKHSGVRAAVHKNLVKTGKIDISWGKFYNKVFENRQMSDYLELVKFEPDQVEEIITSATGFVAELKKLLNP